jgi:hypothetical protein
MPNGPPLSGDSPGDAALGIDPENGQMAGIAKIDSAGSQVHNQNLHGDEHPAAGLLQNLRVEFFDQR